MKSTTQGSAWERFVGIAAAVVLGLVLLVAAWAKAIDPETFTEQIRVEGLDFLGMAAAVAYVAIVIEIALGSALVLAIRRNWVLVPTVLLVLFFLLLTGRAYWRFANGLIDETESCGCFGNLVSRTPAEAFWQDLFLLGVPAILAFVGRSGGMRRFPGKRMAIVALLTAAGLVLALRAPALPLDDLATRLKPGVEVAELCVGAEDDPERLCLDTVISELETGRHWVIVSGLEEEELLAAMPQLNEAALATSEVSFWLLTTAKPEVVATFEWTQAPAFGLREAPPGLVRPLHRRLPRSFRVEQGRVVETVSGLPHMEN